MAFGLIYSQSGTVSNAWLFTGRQYDSESGLYYYRNRYYDPKVGRFITRDPIGITGGINLYQYCGNNPVNYTDWFGLSGTLTIYSKHGNNQSSGSAFGDHSWISYKKDGSNNATYFGTWGHTRGGNKGLRENDVNEKKWSDISGVAKRQKYVDDAQERELDKAIKETKAKDEGAWSYWSPCPDFASDTWKEVTGESLQDRHLGGLGYSDPNVLTDSINKKNSSR